MNHDIKHEWIVEFCQKQNAVPPVSFETLNRFAQAFIAQHALSETLHNRVMLSIHNAMWEETFSRIPIEKRLILLPDCLAKREMCPATFDELGRVCARCGRCQIAEISQKADELGYALLIAESSSVVSQWIESGEIQGVIGVSCEEGLQKAFAPMFKYGIPGVGIALNGAGCYHTSVDTQLLFNAMSLPEKSPFNMLSVEALQSQVNAIFSDEKISQNLSAIRPLSLSLQDAVVHTLSKHGKHYRPAILALLYSAIANTNELPPEIQKLMLAVECFHKASLIHDDIEDNDDLRYNEPTLHHKIGVPHAINIGDLLIGEGYKLILEDPIPLPLRSSLANLAAQAHLDLTVGQALEFSLDVEQATYEDLHSIFRYKTAPAFRIPFLMALYATQLENQYEKLFTQIANDLGVAYQIYDDLEDPNAPHSWVSICMRIENISFDDAMQKTWDTYFMYRQKVLNHLEEIHQTPLKIALLRIIQKVLKNVEK